MNKKGQIVEEKKVDEEQFIASLPETNDLMNKINPSQIDLFHAAFGSEDLAYALLIKKKLKQKAQKKALKKQRSKSRENGRLSLMKTPEM